MKKNLLVMLLLPVILFAQTGKVYESLSMQSKILNSERKYAIYLPSDYQTSERSYPVLYLLHGAGDDQTGWVQFGEVLRITDKTINEGKATPMIIVMPDANTGTPGYMNRTDIKWNYEDFIFQEFIPYIEKTYRIKSEKNYRAIAGLSMGGGGTFIYTLHHPEMFSSACPLSAVTGPTSIEDLKNNSKRMGFKDATDANLEAYYKSNSVLNLMNTMPEDQKKAVRWFIDCGDDDFLFEGNSLVHIAMRKNNIAHEFRIRDGAHNWSYWRASLPTVLEFISDAFHK